MKIKKHIISLATLCFCLLMLLPILPPPTEPDPKPPIGIEPEEPGITPQDDRERPSKG